MKSSWKPIQLGDVVDIQTGFPFKSSEYTTEDDAIPLLRGDNVVQGTFRWEGVKYWPKSGLVEKHNKYWLAEHDVILAMDRPWIEAGLKTSQVSKRDLPCLLVQRVARLRSKKGLDQHYLRYLVSSYWFTEYVKQVQTGTAVPHISPKQIAAFDFLLPPEGEQNEIGSLLKSLDDKIQLNRQMNETLEAMAQALFKSWFVDFDPVIDNALAAGNEIPEPLQKRAVARQALGDQRKPLPAEIQSLFPDSFVLINEMGWVPEGWQYLTLEDVTTELRRGISPKYAEDGGVRVVNQKCIRNHTVNYNLARRNDPVLRKVDGRELFIGDVLVNSTGVGTLGRMAQVLNLDEVTVVDSHVTLVRANPDRFRPYTFGKAMLNIEQIVEAMGEGSTGQTELSRTNLQALKILVPPVQLQDFLEKHLMDIGAKQVQLEKLSLSLIRLRDTLLPKLLSGELRIPDAEKQVAEAV